MEEVMDVMEKNYDNSEFGVQELADALGCPYKRIAHIRGVSFEELMLYIKATFARRFPLHACGNRENPAVFA